MSLFGGLSISGSGMTAERLRMDVIAENLANAESTRGADTQGFVTMPNVDTVTEMVDLITASRGYEANVQAMNAAKQMFQRTLDLLR